MILVVQFCGRAVGVVQQQGERQRRRRTLYQRKEEDLRLKRNGGMGAQLRAKAMERQRAQESESKCKSEQVSQREWEREDRGKTTRGMMSADVCSFNHPIV